MKTLTNSLFILQIVALGLFSNCYIDLSDIDFGGGLGSSSYYGSGFFEIDSTNTIFSSLQIIDHRPDSISVIGNITYDSILVVDQYTFEYRKEGEDDSLAIPIDILAYGDTLDFRDLDNNTMQFYYNLDLDTTYNYLVCHKMSIDCNKNPQLSLSDACYYEWIEFQECADIYLNN